MSSSPPSSRHHLPILTLFLNHQQREAAITAPMEVKGDTRSCMLDHHQQMGGFMECSICLDAAAEPVVTMCGHLYCWPCIYKWMQHAGGEEGAAAAGCPVCKSHLSEHSFIPLYGRGSNRRNTTTKIPDRPSPRLMVDSSAQHQHQQQRRRRPRYQYDDGGYMASASVLHSTAGGVLCGVAEAVLPWVSGSHEGRMYQYHSSPYVIGVSGSSRMRMMRIESSLSQIWGFLFCFAILCFIFF